MQKSLVFLSFKAADNVSADLQKEMTGKQALIQLPFSFPLNLQLLNLVSVAKLRFKQSVQGDKL